MSDEEEKQEALNVTSLAAAIAAGAADAYLKTMLHTLDHDGWTAFADASVAAHRRGDIDLTALLDGPTDRRIGHATQRLVGHALPASGMSLADVLRLDAAAAARTQGEGIPYWLSAAFGEWCRTSPDNVVAAFDALKSGEAAPRLAQPAVAAALAVDRARFLPTVLAMLDGSDEAGQDAAANVLGRIEDLAPADLDATVAALEAALSRARGDRVVAPLRALLAIAMRGQGAVGARALGEAATRADAHVREAVAMEMMFGAAKAPPEVTRPALALLAGTGADEIATIEGIDHILAENLSGPLAADFAGLTDRLLVGGVASMKRLDSYQHRLLEAGAGAVGLAVTRWLLGDELRLYAAVSDICLSVHGDPLTFELDFSGSGLTAERAVRIARRSCGVLLISPEAAASIIVSLMRSGPADAIPALAEILWDPLLISYWIGPRKYLEDVLPGLPPAAAEAVTGVIARLERYSAAVEAARDMPELRPSQHHRHLVAIKRREEQIAIEKAAREGSVLASLFPMSVMLFGDSAIYDVVTEPGKTIRQETPLGVHEYSHELPRLDVIDPFGTWYQRATMMSDGGDE
ncbi:MAG TPA: hypothetical protein VEC11_08530 [Allosphingosinicella sp.]|nr:hypothetical protein [Allosphingosinicella sp.]